MSYTDAQVSAATAAMDKYRGGHDGELGAALVVVGLSAERADKEAQIRDDMIRVAHRVGASLRQLADVSGLGRKTVTAIVSAGPTGARLTDPDRRTWKVSCGQRMTSSQDPSSTPAGSSATDPTTTKPAPANTATSPGSMAASRPPEVWGS